jgi:hypothetical protein
MHVVICIIVDAFVHFMHLHEVSVVCVVVHNTLVPPICACLTPVVSIVSLSVFDAFVLLTHLFTVLTTCTNHWCRQECILPLVVK